MKKIKLFIIQIFLFSCLIISNSFSKALPPGSGVADVPANVLILLDKSGSMSATSYSGANINRPYSITPISNTGNYITHDGSTIYGVNHSANANTSIVGSRNTYRLRQRFPECSTYYDRGQNVLYHNNHIYLTGKYFYHGLPVLCKVNTTTGVKTKIMNISNNRYAYIGLQKHNDIIFVVSNDRRISLYNTSTNQSKVCSTSGTLNRAISGSSVNARMRFTVDASGNLVFLTQNLLYKFSRSGMNCPGNNPSYTNSRFTGQLSSSIAMAGHPSNENILYLMSRSTITKATLTGSGNNVSSNSVSREVVGRHGYVNPNTYNPTSKSAIRFRSLRDIKIDHALNRIFVADFDQRMVQTLDLDMNYHGHSGYSSRQSRMSGAHQAIQSLVTDSSLVSSVNFGFGYWSHDTGNYIYWHYYRVNSSYVPCRSLVSSTWLYNSHWLVRYNRWCRKPSGGVGYTSWNNSRNEANPCGAQNCLKVKVDRNGAARINSYIKSVRPGGGTDANTWAKIAEQYYNHNSDSPIDKNSPCQGSYVIVIGDGDMSNTSSAENKVRNLLNQKKVKTFTVAYGGGLSSNGIRQLDRIAKAGGTSRVIKADTTDQLKAQLNAAIRSVIADKLSFTAPAITATIEEGGSLFQAQFKYKQNMEWQGALTRTAISKDGVVNEKDSGNWNASDMIPAPAARKIWGIIPGVDYKTDYNNYVEANSALIQSQFSLFGNAVGDYHRDTPKVSGVTGNTRCSRKGDSTATIADGIDDDVKGLISFSRGEDYFDYDGDCILNEQRKADGKKAYLGDIFHSEMVVVGAPSADTAFTSTAQEAYWRSIKGYDAWAQSLSGRAERIYVGGNDGMLHSIDSKTGVEKWAFIPPFIMSQMPLMVNTNLNNDLAKVKGGTNAIYGVDGSPVVHDMYFRSPLGSSKNWHTILMVPYGRGGNGFTVLDVTNPDKPLHLYSVYNDHIKNKVFVMNHLDVVSEYEYIDDTYSVIDLVESQTVTDNYNNDNSIDDECKANTTTSCYESRTWTFPVAGLTKADFLVNINNKNIPNFTVQTGSTGLPEITFPQLLSHQANPDRAGSSDTLTIKLTRAATQRLSTNLPAEYNYKELGETWSAPRIFRLPNSGAGDSNIEDDIYVAVMGGGYGGRNDGVGSALFVINLEDRVTPGKVEKVIEVVDDKNLNITNSIPGTPVVITADTTRGITFKGALVYTNDFEGKVTKYNLTNMDNDGARNPINLYDHTTLLSIGASKENGRYQYHSMDAGIGKTSKHLWLFSGTGDYERLTFRDSKLNNIMYGFRDTDFPLYVKKNDALSTLFKLERCSDTTNDSTGVDCPLTTNKFSRIARAKKNQGWYINLPASQKISAEPTLSNGLVYYPIFEPSQSQNKCSLGLALICAVDDECGTNVSKQLHNNKSLQSQTIDGKVYAGRTCKAVGQGVLSRLVVFANKLFANIAGKSIQNKTDLVVIDTGMGDIESFRSSWREGNF
ncbi:PilC/PilY family type IV pilus protein [Candidatus Pelagibacter communis]|uniref:PilC/PilY family type IV pilus protein n=1 Tax=Pelagibacter ubique TaxID=198252 RepID=UPI00094D5426|nr:PilC/PilY family type IV pilus protein [Candidatus Pelagibacter ubique]